MPSKYSKRHYEDIAGIMNDASKEIYENVHWYILQRLIETFKSNNPRFDEDKFLIASGANAIVEWKYGVGRYRR